MKGNTCIPVADNNDDFPYESSMNGGSNDFLVSNIHDWMAVSGDITLVKI